MRFERKHKRIIIVCIAVFFILYGFLDMKFNFNFSAEVEDKVTWVLTIIAVALLFSSAKPKPKNDEINNIQDNSGSTEEKTIDSENSTKANINDDNRKS